MHDARENRPVHTVFEFDKGRGITGGRTIKYLNVELAELKEVAVDLIKLSPCWSSSRAVAHLS
jgi:aminopeptidase C